MNRITAKNIHYQWTFLPTVYLVMCKLLLHLWVNFTDLDRKHYVQTSYWMTHRKKGPKCIRSEDTCISLRHRFRKGNPAAGSCHVHYSTTLSVFHEYFNTTFLSKASVRHTYSHISFKAPLLLIILASSPKTAWVFPHNSNCTSIIHAISAVTELMASLAAYFTQYISASAYTYCVGRKPKQSLCFRTVH